MHLSHRILAQAEKGIDTAIVFINTLKMKTIACVIAHKDVAILSPPYDSCT